MQSFKIAILMLLVLGACVVANPPSDPDAGVDAAPPYHDVACDTLHCTTVECPGDGTPCTCYWPPANPLRCNGPSHHEDHGQ